MMHNTYTQQIISYFSHFAVRKISYSTARLHYSTFSNVITACTNATRTRYQTKNIQE